MSERIVRRGMAAIVAGLVTALWVGGCDGITDPPPAYDLPILLSDPTADPAVSPPSASRSGETVSTSAVGATTAPDVTYVSLSPGSVPDGQSATIRNQRRGNVVTVSIVDGGFDPVPILANEGDTLVVDVRVANSSTPLTTVRTVPGKRPPRIVRTNPPPKKRDVALNASMLVVFSEPMDPTTVVAPAIQLRRNGDPVAGRVEHRDESGLTFAFVPAAALLPATEYELVLTTVLRDRDGEPLDSAITVPFITRPVSVPNASEVLVPDHVGTIQEAVDAVTPGGVVRVRPGLYAEPVVINKGVTIERSGETGEVRLAPPAGSPSGVLVTTAAPVTLRRLTIDVSPQEPGTSGDDGYEGVLGMGPAHIFIEESTVLRADRGVLIINDSATTQARGRLVVRNSTFDGGDMSRMESGVFAVTDVHVLVERSTFRRTTWSCIQIQSNGDVDLFENDVDECGPYGGIRVWSVGRAVNVIGNTVRNSGRSNSRFGIFYRNAHGVIERNTVINYVQADADPSFDPAGIRLGNADVRVRFNDVSGNRYADLRNVTRNHVVASCNWWGSVDGPSNTGGSGDAVIGDVAFVPFATGPMAHTADTACSGQPPPATQLVFSVQPGTSVAGDAMAPAVRVTARDALGRISSTFTGSVSVGLATNPGGATLGGSITARAVNGVATFYNLSLDRSGSGYVLAASTAGLSPATSAPFDIVLRSTDVVYAQNFETGPAPEWSSTRRNSVPNDAYPSPTFLGEFGCYDFDAQQPDLTQAENCREADAVTLTLGGLPQHNEITITFDLYVIRSWDGNNLGNGRVAPDLFNLAVVGGPTLLNASFAVHGERPYQSYPAEHPTDGSPPPNNPRLGGALAVNALGYDMDAVYRLTFTFSHTGSTVTFRFTAPELQALSDESWGLDNVEVRSRVR